MLLKDQVAIVTGGTRGIGRAIAHELLKEGARVALIDLVLQDVEQTASELVSANNGETLGIAANVSFLEEVEEMTKKVLDKFKRIDILINNAGITRDNLLLRMSEEEWDSVLAVNLKGVFNCTKVVSRYLLKNRQGRIVNITSVVGQTGNAGQANYAASKGGVIAFTKSCAREFASRNVLVNAVAPGFIDTPMTAVLSEEIRTKLKEQIPLGRLGQPEDIARAVLFLVGPASAYITGQILPVNGGMYM